jgi:hypothetical protein
MLLAASVQGLAQQADKTEPGQPSLLFPRIAYDERAWKPFVSTDGGFTIAFPGKPGLHTQTIPSEPSPLVNHMHGLDIGVSVFAASFTDLPPGVHLSNKKLINQALDAGRDSEVAGAGGKLISETPLMLDGYTGRYILYSDADGLTHSQSYIVGNRLYQLHVVSDDYRNSPAADQKFFKDLVNRFFTSFKLTRKAK